MSDSRLWAVTSFFPLDDPPGVRRRLQVFREFRRRLSVPLVAVELSLDGEFQLDEGSADIVIQVHGGDVLWQKERLLNLGFEAPPAECDAVAWIDCDLVFEQKDWAAAAVAALEERALVQLFDEALYLRTPYLPGDDPRAQVHYRRVSAGSRFRDGQPLDFTKPMAGGPAPGFAWAGRREILLRQGLYEAMVIGSGDRGALCAATGQQGVFAEWLPSSEAHRRHYLDWAAGFEAAARDGVTALHGTIFHLWHGDLSTRGYHTRYQDFGRFSFDPVADLETTEQGAWAWSSEKPELHQYLRDHFASRAAQPVSDR